MERYFYSYEAILGMLSECFRFDGRSETGGILIGPDENPRIITDILVSSSYAERQALTYCQNEEDVKILNGQLKEYQDKGYDYRGDFHRHFRMKVLSKGDLMQCAEVLLQKDYKINNQLVMNIVTDYYLNDDGLPVFSYLVSLDDNDDVTVSPVKITVFPKKYLCLLGDSICGSCLKGGGNNESAYSGHSKERIKKAGSG